jgi:hypothetical protein
VTLVLAILGAWLLASVLLLAAAYALHTVATRRETARRAATSRALEGAGPQLDLVQPGVPDRRDPEAPRSVRTRPVRRMVH